MSSSLSRWECFNILGLSSTASQDEIRQAYRTKAVDNHPDKNPDDPRATERFQRISQAYRVLAEDNNTYVDDSDSDEEYGGGLRFGMFMYFRMFEELMREARREEDMRRQRLRDEIFMEHLFGWRNDPWQQQPHRRREPDWSPPRRTSQQTSGRTSQQNSGRTSQQTSGRTSQQTSGRTSQQTSGRTSRQNSWTRSKQTSAWPSQTHSGTSSQQTSVKQQRTTPLTRKNTSRPNTSFKNQQLSKKQLLAQQKRREKEADEIGKEIRKKTELFSNLKLS